MSKPFTTIVDITWEEVPLRVELKVHDADASDWTETKVTAEGDIIDLLLGCDYDGLMDAVDSRLIELGLIQRRSE